MYLGGYIAQDVFNAVFTYYVVFVLFGLSSLSYAVLYYAGLSDVYSLLLISAVAGLGRGGINYVPWNTYTYADVDEVITDQRHEGIFAGIMTLTRKASQAGAVMLVAGMPYDVLWGNNNIGYLNRNTPAAPAGAFYRPQ